MQKVIYCEWLTFGNPIEREMELEKAMERYKSKENALKGYVFKDLCFIGIKSNIKMMNGDDKNG